MLRLLAPIAVVLALAAPTLAADLPGADVCLGEIHCDKGPRASASETSIPYDPAHPADPERVLDAYYVAKEPGENRAAVLMIPQGGWHTAGRGSWSGRALNLSQETGWVVFVMDYNTTARNKWDSQPRDVENAIRWIRAHAADYDIDTTRIAAAGSSAGAHLAMLTGMKGSGSTDTGTRLAAISAWSGPTDMAMMTTAFGCRNVPCPLTPTGDHTGGSFTQWFEADCYRTTCGYKQVVLCYPDEPPTPGAWPECGERYLDTSPSHHVDETDPPVQIWHGSADPVVPYSQAQIMAGVLEENGVHAECPPVPSSDHGDALYQEAWTGTKDFLKRMLNTTRTYGPVCDIA